MTLTIELTPEQEARLAAAAEQQGVAPVELAREILTAHLPQITRVEEEGSRKSERDPQLAARVSSIRGKYARFAVTTEALHLERQAEKLREERQLEERR